MGLGRGVGLGILLTGVFENFDGKGEILPVLVDVLEGELVKLSKSANGSCDWLTGVT